MLGVVCVGMVVVWLVMFVVKCGGLLYCEYLCFGKCVGILCVLYCFVFDCLVLMLLYEWFVFVKGLIVVYFD